MLCSKKPSDHASDVSRARVGHKSAAVASAIHLAPGFRQQHEHDTHINMGDMGMETWRSLCKSGDADDDQSD